jgi:hypothetical protein
MSAERASFGFSLFCDDIRQEVGGKLSLMGLYQSDMVFPKDTTFPLILPKFVIFVKYYESTGTFSEDLTLKITLPGDQADSASITRVISRSELDNTPLRYPKTDDSEPLYTVNFPMVFNPFILSNTGYISVRMYCGQEKTRLGRLMIRTVEEGENIGAPGF